MSDLAKVVLEKKHNDKRKSLKSQQTVKMDTDDVLSEYSEHSENPLLFVSVVACRRLSEGKNVNPFCCLHVDEVEQITNIFWSNPTPQFRESFIFHMKGSISKTCDISVYSKSPLSKDVFLGHYVIDSKELQNEEVSSKWYNLESKDSNEVAVPGSQICLKTQYFFSEKGIRYKLNELIDLAFYEDFESFFISLKPSTFCLIFDNNKCIPNPQEVNAISTIIINTPGIKPTNVLKFVVEGEVNSNSSTATLFRRNTLASKLMTSCLNRFGKTYLQGILKPIIMNICDKNLFLEVDPDKLKDSDEISKNAERLIEVTEELVNVILKSVNSLPYEIREVAGILRKSVEKFMDPSIERQSVASLLFLRFITPSVASPIQTDIVKRQPSRESSRTLLLVSKILQNIANNVQFEKKEKFLAFANPLIEKYQEPLTKMLEDVIDLSKVKLVTSTIDNHKRTVDLHGLLKATEEDLIMLYSFYLLHRYFHKSFGQIRNGFAQKPPDVTLPIDDLLDVDENLNKLEKLLVTMKEPVELKIHDDDDVSTSEKMLQSLKDISAKKRSESMHNKK